MSEGDGSDDLEMIRELIAEGYLEKGTPAAGIALEWAHNGGDRLSPKQKGIFDRVVAPEIEDLMRRRGVIGDFRDD